MAGVRKTANKILCRSNVRQLGLGIAMYADDYREALPPSVYTGMYDPSLRQSHKTTTLRIGDTPMPYQGDWDGLGMLYALDYLRTPQVFYCPAERGPTSWQNYSPHWSQDGVEIVGNYQYRGEGPNGEHFLTEIRPDTSALVTNALTSKAAYSHGDGSNVLRADLSVFWFSDLNGILLSKLADDPFLNGPGDVEGAWDTIDDYDAPPAGN